jgi:hypothetical protein
VEIDEVGQTVTKTYLRYSHEIAVSQVEREVSHASRLSAALSDADGLACPDILDWNLTPPPCLVMTLCPGEVLSSMLERPGKPEIAVAEIADRIHRGILVYTSLFKEPYHDCGFHNMLYDETSKVLTLLDFGMPARIDETQWSSPIEASLGNLVGCACYELVRPSRLHLAKRGFLDLLQAVLATFEDEACKCRIRAAAQSNLKRLTHAGSAIRRKYYDTIGAAMIRHYFTHLKLTPATAVPAKIPGSLDGSPGEFCPECALCRKR